MNTLKKIALVITLIASITTINAQLSVGIGAGYNEGIDAPGLLVKGEFEIMDGIVISPSVSYFTGSTLYGFKNNLLAFDVNGQYIIEIMADELKVYPLAGLNYSSYKHGFNTGNDFIRTSNTGNALGLNVGGGGRWYFSDQMSVFAELKYTVSNLSQVVVGAGILFEL